MDERCHFLALEPNKILSLYCWQLLTSSFIGFCASYFVCKCSMLQIVKGLGAQMLWMPGHQGIVSVSKAPRSDRRGDRAWKTGQLKSVDGDVESRWRPEKVKSHE